MWSALYIYTPRDKLYRYIRGFTYGLHTAKNNHDYGDSTRKVQPTVTGEAAVFCEQGLRSLRRKEGKLDTNTCNGGEYTVVRVLNRFVFMY